MDDNLVVDRVIDLMDELREENRKLREKNEGLKSQLNRLKSKDFTFPEIFADNPIFEKLQDPSDYDCFEVQNLEPNDFAIIIVEENIGIIYFMRPDHVLQPPENYLRATVTMTVTLLQPGQAEKALECLYSMINTHFSIREYVLGWDLAPQPIYVFS